MDHRPFGNGGRHRTAPLWQRDWLDAYPRGIPSSLSYPATPVSALLENAAERYPQRPACTIFGKAASYGSLAAQAHALAGALANLGAGPGRRVGMLLPNIPEYIVALQATWLTGATPLQLSPLMVAEEIKKWLQATDCHMVVTLDLLTPALRGALREGPLEHVVVASLAGRMTPVRGWLYRVERIRRRGPIRLRDGAHLHRFESLLRTPSRPLCPPVHPEEDVALLSPTGGTTASPKAVMLTHANLIANALQLRAWSAGEQGGEDVLGVLPFFHAYGLSVCLLCSLAMAGTVHGAHNVVEGYGLSEASPVTHCNPLDGRARVGSIGLPLPDTEARIVDEATGQQELPIGEVGELVVRGPQVMKGYFNNPAETALALRDGWLYTGDLGCRDRDGFFRIVDRKKDIIKTSGFLVYPAEVEEVLAAFPGVAEAVVVGEPDAERGEVIRALVVSRNGPVDVAALAQHCERHLSKHKRPRRIEVVRELPKNFLGKVQRRKVREGK